MPLLRRYLSGTEYFYFDPGNEEANSVIAINPAPHDLVRRIGFWKDNVVYWKTKRKIKDDLQCNKSFKRISKRISIEVCG